MKQEKTLELKIAEAKQKLEKKQEEKKTIVQRVGIWTFSWIVMWAFLAGASLTFVWENKSVLSYSETIIVENVQAQTTIDAQIEEEAPQIAEFEGIEAEFTAYNAMVGQTDDDPYTMASTRRVYEGALACPLKYKFGTRIEIEGLGIYTCEDRMAIEKREGEYFDVFMWEEDAAWKFGKKTLSYKIID